MKLRSEVLWERLVAESCDFGVVANGMGGN